MRQRPLGIAGDWHAVALRVRAPQRVERCIGSDEHGSLLCTGLILAFQNGPTPRRDIADDCLSAGMDVDVFNAHRLPAAATQLRQGFSLKRESP